LLTERDPVAGIVFEPGCIQALSPFHMLPLLQVPGFVVAVLEIRNER
jgi:hypothetical protein